jgi:hypothetical protein
VPRYVTTGCTAVLGSGFATVTPATTRKEVRIELKETILVNQVAMVVIVKQKLLKSNCLSMIYMDDLHLSYTFQFLGIILLKRRWIRKQSCGLSAMLSKSSTIPIVGLRLRNFGLAKIVASIPFRFYPILGSSRDRLTIALVITFVQSPVDQSSHVPSRYSDLR